MMDGNHSANKSTTKIWPWRQVLAKYEKPQNRASIWQIVSSIVPFLVLWYLMYLSLSVSYWLVLALAPFAAGFMVRIFIIFHDCGHGSFFKSKKAKNFWGFITGILTFTPYHQWRHDHAVHHATACDLDRRGVGDVWMLTVEEYRNLPRRKKLTYRIYRNPLVMFTVGAFYLFLINNRFPTPGAARRERHSVYWTNLAILGISVIMSLAIGFVNFVLIQLPVLAMAASAGVWLFYVQHQFEGVYWERHEKWDYVKAALYGSSFYKLPRILQWFTGNIGFHHVHHLGQRVPNYHLERCYRENRLFQEVKPVTLRSSLKSLTLRLWDEKQHKLVGYKVLRTSHS
ncbi:MAG: fatty acid desaturase [bacterium]